MILCAALLPASLAATVLPRPQALSGAWYDPASNGEGYSVLVAESGLVVTWYGYDAQGQRLWLVSETFAGSVELGVPITLNLFRGGGGVFTQPLASIQVWGSLSLRFDDCTHGLATLTGLDGAKTSQLQQFAGVREQGRCDTPPVAPEYLAFGNPQPVNIRGYTEDAMEPFISRDGRYLLFNNSNAPEVNTDLHYAERVSDVVFDYRGPVSGANSPVLDGVASLDDQQRFYFVSTRSYAQTLSTLYQGRFDQGSVTDVGLVPGISRSIPGQVNFDAEISADGQTLIFVDGTFSGSAFPDAADLAIAARNSDGFARLANSGELLATINSTDLEYAPCLSRNGLELYFSRYADGEFAIYRSTRWRGDAAFEAPQRVRIVDDFIEAPALSPDERSLYFHRRVGARFEIWRVQR
ncbi:MAG: TolB family protein [Lysobacterales bacterium]